MKKDELNLNCLHFFRQELESLQTQVNTEREKYQQNAVTSSISAIPALCINDLFTLSQVCFILLSRRSRRSQETWCFWAQWTISEHWHLGIYEAGVCPQLIWLITIEILLFFNFKLLKKYFRSCMESKSERGLDCAKNYHRSHSEL